MSETSKPKTARSYRATVVGDNTIVHIDYLVITDQDSTQHLYRPSIGEGMIVGDNYCYKHNIWEDVRKTSE